MFLKGRDNTNKTLKEKSNVKKETHVFGKNKYLQLKFSKSTFKPKIFISYPQHGCQMLRPLDNILTFGK
jgi:hypothetical protein